MSCISACPVHVCVLYMHAHIHVHVFEQVDSPPPPPAVSPTLQNKLIALIKAHQFELSQLGEKYVEPRTLNLMAYVFYSPNVSKRLVRLLILEEVALNSNNEALKFLAKKEFVQDVSSHSEIRNIQVSLLVGYGLCGCYTIDYLIIRVIRRLFYLERCTQV